MKFVYSIFIGIIAGMIAGMIDGMIVGVGLQCRRDNLWDMFSVSQLDRLAVVHRRFKTSRAESIFS